ncbi:EAL domain-containing protein [Shewanella canadensis]|uniref:EAL domain-containing protein n=1 Tax=Shewanella canadensis TaxID=271096 RepID=A0A3S0IRK4_9GAMM|nr:EAL domain-containing protein [Shewanella canadensis]RTR40365.1 EAL domain-containing protein [Shewanella canadensis]
MQIAYVKKLLFPLLLLLTCQAPAMAGDLVSRVFNEREGLTNSQINDISFDEYGFVWLATDEGLYRLSNSKVRRIDKVEFDLRLSDEYINIVEPLSQKHLLVSNYSDNYLYDILANRFIKFGSDELFPDFKGESIIAQVKRADGSFIFLTREGELLKFSYQQSSLERIIFLPNNADVLWHNLVSLDDGRIMVGTEYELQLRDSKGRRIAVLPWEEKDGLMKWLFKDSKGRVWLSSTNGVYRVDVDNLQINRVKELPYYTTKIAEDNHGDLWISSHIGLIKWRPGSTEHKLFQKQLKESADIDYINDIAIDSTGIIWVGGSGDGLAVLADDPDFLIDKFTMSEPYTISNEMIWAIFAEDENIWLGTDNGLIVIDKNTKQSKTLVPDGIELNDSIYKIDVLGQNHLLLSTTNGLFVVDKRNFTAQRFAQWTQGEYSLEHKVVYTSYNDPSIEGRWWFLTMTGLYFWEPGMLNPQEMPIAGADTKAAKRDLRALFRDESGRLWIGGGGFFGFLDSEGLFHSRIDIFSDEDTDIEVNYIKQVESGVFWLGTSPSGLFEYIPASGRVKALDKEWLIDCSSVFFIHQTDEHRVIGCPYSIIRQEIESENILVIDEDDGLIGDELNDGAYFYDPGYGLYLGTPDGAMAVNIDDLSNRIQRDKVFLEAVSVFYDDDTQIDLIPQVDKVILPGARMISFQVTSLDYLDDTPMTLQYRLRRKGDRSESHYLLLEGQSQLNITGLSSGKYHLDILSQENGIWSKVPHTFEFRVKQFWWQTQWFKGLILFTVLCIGIGVIVYRQRQVKAFKLVNSALVESEDRLRQSLKGSDSELWEWRHDTQMFSLENRGAKRKEDRKNKLLTLNDFPVHRDEKDKVLASWNNMIEGYSDRFDVEYRYRREDKTWGWTRVRGRPVELDPVSGKILRVAGIYADITAQRQLEDDVKLLAQAFGNTSEGVLILDASERIKVSNKAAQTIIGSDARVLTHKYFSDLMVAKEGRSDEIAHLLDQGVSWTGEREFVCANGSSCPVWLNVSTMLGGKGDITHYVAVFSDITERKRTEADLRRLANYDVLTGLPNRSLFSTRLAQSIHRAEHSGEKLALIFLDLDRFKHVNDSYGHSMGDALLVEAASRLLSCISEEHTLCRFGGDEFVLLIRDADNIDKINHVCTELLVQIEAPFELFGREFFISTSIGVSLWPDDTRQPEVLIKNADQAMYHAKEEGRGNFQYFSSERNAEALYHLRLEGELRKAIERDEFELHYQPQVDILRGDKLIGMEALLRWRHHKDGLVRTDVFIKVAESCGLIIDIDRWVLRQACVQGALWANSYNEKFKLSVNISAVHFRQPDFIDGVRSILEETKIPPSALGFEITEGVLMKELHIAKDHLRDLRELGIDVAIDDFGTGYSSLAYLRHFDVDTLKIDRSFLIDIATNETDQAIASSIIELARNLKLNVVAEGVETKEQLEQVFSRGCYVIQGYYFSKPLTVSDMESYMGLQKTE